MQIRRKKSAWDPSFKCFRSYILRHIFSRYRGGYCSRRFNSHDLSTYVVTCTKYAPYLRWSHGEKSNCPVQMNIDQCFYGVPRGPGKPANPGILFCHFPRLGSPGNLLNLTKRIWSVWKAIRRTNLEIDLASVGVNAWKINWSPGRVLGIGLWKKVRIRS